MFRFVLILVLIATAAACDKPQPVDVPSEPPQWVKEAQERSEAAQAPVSVPEPEVTRVVDKPLLWSVTTPSGAASHVLGSYHVGTDFQGLSALPGSVRKAFDDCNVVVLEADVGAPVDDAAQPFIVLQGRQTLESMLKPDLWDVLVEQAGLPPQQLLRLQPHMAVSLLTQKWTPNPGVRGMDGRFIILAKAHEKSLAFLETPVEQVEMLSKQVTLEMLAEMLEDPIYQKGKLEKMRKAFVAGDADAIEQMTFDPAEIKSAKNFHQAVFWDRNQRWVPLLKPHLDAGHALVVVGAGHLVGDKSVLALLEDQGYAVARVEP